MDQLRGEMEKLYKIENHLKELIIHKKVNDGKNIKRNHQHLVLYYCFFSGGGAKKTAKSVASFTWQLRKCSTFSRQLTQNYKLWGEIQSRSVCSKTNLLATHAIYHLSPFSPATPNTLLFIEPASFTLPLLPPVNPKATVWSNDRNRYKWPILNVRILR